MYCSTCSGEREFEQPPCPDGHGPDCPERVCVDCGTAYLVGLIPRPRPTTAPVPASASASAPAPSASASPAPGPAASPRAVA